MLSCVILLGGWKEDWARTRVRAGGGRNVPILILMLGLNQTKVLYPTMNVPLHTPITVCYTRLFFSLLYFGYFIREKTGKYGRQWLVQHRVWNPHIGTKAF